VTHWLFTIALVLVAGYFGQRIGRRFWKSQAQSAIKVGRVPCKIRLLKEDDTRLAADIWTGDLSLTGPSTLHTYGHGSVQIDAPPWQLLDLDAGTGVGVARVNSSLGPLAILFAASVADQLPIAR
jgi:hypothetical protein